MSRRLPLVASLAALALVALAAPALGAFPGRNGDLGYGWSQLDEPELGPFRYVNAIRVIAPRDGEPRTVTGCEQTVGVGAPLPRAGCLFEVFRDPAFAPSGTRVAFDHGVNLALVDSDGTDLLELPAQGADDGEPAFSARGGRLAFSTGPSASGPDADEHGIMVRNLVRDTVHEVTSPGTHPAWSSRNWIAFERNGRIWRVRPGGRDLDRLTRRRGSAPAWSPHGTKIAFVRGDAILILDLRTHRLRRAIDGTNAVDLAWSPNGRSLAWATSDGSVWVARTNGANARVVVAGGVGATYNLAALGVDWQPLR